MSYNSQIQLNVNLTPLNELKKQLDSTIKSLEKDSNIKLNINVNEINTSFKEMSNIISNLSNQLNKSFKLDTSSIDNVGNKLKNIQNLSSTSNTFKVNADGTTELVKSVDKINVGLGETITLTKDAQGQLTAMSNIDYSKKQKEIDEQYKLQLKDLEELNKLELKRQQELEKSQQKVKSIQEALNSKLNNSSKNNLIDENVLKNLQKELNSINVDTPISKIKELKTQINNLGSSDNQIVKLQNEINKMTSGLSSLKGKYGNLVGNSNSKKELEDYINEINKLKTTLNDLKSGKSFTGNQLSQQFATARNSSNELTNAVKNNASALKLAQKDASSFGDTIKHAFQNAGIYVGTYEAIRKTIGVIKDASQYVIQLDSALVGLKKVTNETDATYKAFLETAHSASLELGTQADKFTEATESWAKTGKSLNEATQLAKNTMLLSKVGDVADVDTAQTYLLPALQAFNIEAEKSINLVDKYNNISNNMATDVPKMGEAMARGASSLSVAGNSLEETLALIATASQNTQLSGETIGNGLKSISLRIAEFKDEDGEVIPKFEEQMKSLGVTMRDQDGQILSTYNILNQVAQKYGEMDKNTQLMTSQLLGGKYQANVVSSILSDVGELNRAYNLANNSAGSATKEFATYQQSIQYSIDQLKENINHLYTEIVNSDALKSFVNGLSEVVQWLDSLDSETIVFIGTMGTTILLLTKLSKLNKTLMMSEAVSGLGKFIGLATGMIKLENGITGLSGAFGLLSGGIKSATASAMAFVATPLGAVITAIGVAIGIATVAFTSYKKHQEDLVKQSDDLKEAINGVNEAIANGDTSLASKQLDAVREQQKELQNLIKQRQELLKKDSNDFNQSTGGVDKQSAIDGVNKRIKEQIEVVKKAGLSVNEYTGEIDILVEKEQLIANENIVDKIEAETKAQIENKSELQNATQEYQNHISTIQSLYSEYQNLSSQENLSVQQKERLNGVIATLQGQFANLNIKIDENGRAYIENTPLIEDQISYLNSEGVTVDSLTGIRVNDSRVMSEWMVNGTSVTYTEIQKRIINYQQEIKAIQALIQARMLEANAEITAKAPDMNQDSMNDARAESKFLKQKQMHENQIGSAEKSLKELQNIKAQADAIYGGVSASNLSGGGGGNVAKYSGLGSGGGSSSKGGSGGSKAKESDTEKWVDKIKDLSSDIDIDRYADLNSQLEILDNNLTDNKNSLNGLTEGTKAYYDKQKEQIDIIKEQASTYSLLAGSYATERDELKQKLSQYGILTDATGRLTNAEAKLKYQQDLANNMSGNTEAEYNAKKKQIDATKELQENIKRYREVTESEIPKCTQKWDELNESIIKTQKEQLQSLLDSLATNLGKEYTKQKENEMSALDDWYNARKEVLEKNYQDDIDSFQKEKQKIVDEYDEQIKKLQAQLDALNDDTDDKNAKLAKLKMELSLWNKELDGNNPFAKNRINELQQEVANLEKDIQKDNLQKQIDELKDKQSAENDYYDDKIDSLKNNNDDELDELEKSYKEQQDEAEKKYNDLLDEQNLYKEASLMITQNQQDRMVELLNSYSESYKNAGNLLGENFKDGLIAQVQQAMESLNSLTGGTLGNISNNTYSSKESNIATSSGNNSSGTNSKSSNNTINGKSYTVDSNGNISSKDSLSNEEIEEILKNVPRYATGGDINIKGDKEKLIFAGGGEKVLNPTDSNTLNKLSEFVDSGTLDNLFNLAKSIDISGMATIPNNISIPTGTISGMNFRNISNSNTNNNTTNGDVNINMNNNINNNNLQQLGMNQRMLEKMIGKAVSNSISKYGGKK